MLQNAVVSSEHKAIIMLTAFTWFHLHNAIVCMRLFTQEELHVLAFSYAHQSLSPITSDIQDIEWGETELMGVLQTFFSTELNWFVSWSASIPSLAQQCCVCLFYLFATGMIWQLHIEKIVASTLKHWPLEGKESAVTVSRAIVEGEWLINLHEYETQQTESMYFIVHCEYCTRTMMSIQCWCESGK